MPRSLCTPLYLTHCTPSVPPLLCRYGEKMRQLGAGAVGAYEELFAYACPKFVAPTAPDYTNPQVCVGVLWGLGGACATCPQGCSTCPEPLPPALFPCHPNYKPTPTWRLTVPSWPESFAPALKLWHLTFNLYCLPPFLQANTNLEAYRAQLASFMTVVEERRHLPALKQFLKLYSVRAGWHGCPVTPDACAASCLHLFSWFDFPPAQP